MHLRDACKEVMEDKEVQARYRYGMDGNDILNEIQKKHGEDAFKYCTVIDVVDEMRELYG